MLGEYIPLLGLLVGGVSVVAFRTRGMDEHKQNRNKASQHLWEEEFCSGLGNMIYQLYVSEGLFTTLKQNKKVKEELPDEIPEERRAEVTDISEDIGSDIPYSPKIRNQTEEIRDSVRRIDEIHDSYDDILKFRLLIGSCMILSSLTGALALYCYNQVGLIHPFTTITLILACISFAGIFISLYYQVKKANKIKSEVPRYLNGE